MSLMSEAATAMLHAMCVKYTIISVHTQVVSYQLELAGEVLQASSS